MVSSSLSIPPPKSSKRASNSISRYIVSKTGSNTEPSPFPPEIVADEKVKISKSCGSTLISFTLPSITAVAKAVVKPAEGESISITGALTTS